MTYEEVVRKVPCPACMAPRGKFCTMGAGRLRAEPHTERTASATRGAGASGVRGVRGMLARFGIGKKPA